MKTRLALFPLTTTVSPGDEEPLHIAGCHLADLAHQYGTPLYVYDAATVKTAVSRYRQALTHYPGNTGLTYAGKAYLSVKLAQWLQAEGLWIDCTGLGELAIAATARVPREQILLHGVNKTMAVLQSGIAQAGTIVVDNLTELARLVDLQATATEPFPNIWLRFRPGQLVDTHHHSQTGHDDSKFGMGWDEILTAVALCQQHHLPLKGLHFHLGSQFDDANPVNAALEKTLDLAATIRLGPDWTLCPGGGLGVAYHESDLPHPDVSHYGRRVADWVVAGCQKRNLPYPKLHLEPGRSLVAQAGVSIYRVGTVKQTPARRWLLLDGGLADNPRPALYQAAYTALPVKKPFRPPTTPATLAGPYCESGDILIEHLPLPDIALDELIAIPVSGAYQLSMANNYNGAQRPAVLWLEEGQATLMQRREPISALQQRDNSNRNDMPIVKYHGCGNDYLVVEAADWQRPFSPAMIQRLCHRNLGPGSDGLLVNVSTPDQFAVRIFNPDGSEAEKSGNGLRIFTRYLFDRGIITTDPVTIKTQGGDVSAQILENGRFVQVNMGQATFDSQQIPVAGARRDVLNETITVDNTELIYSAVSLGNPHCIIQRDFITPEETQRLGPLLEIESRFPRRTNVQFMQLRDRQNIQIEIWERGAGYTLASGSSSCAAAIVAYRLGLCEANITVHMPGGEIVANIEADQTILMTGAVSKVWEGRLSAEVLAEL